MHSKASVMDPFLFTPDLAEAVRAPSRFAVLSAALTASSPQHSLACRRRPLVDLASPVSRNRRTSRPCFPLQWVAAHTNTWTRRCSTYSIQGIRLKKTYIGEVQSLARRSGNKLSTQHVYKVTSVLNSASADSAGISRTISSSSLVLRSYTTSTSGSV